MRFATYTAQNGEQFYGAVAKDGMIALSPDFPYWPTLRDVIAADGFRALERGLDSRIVTHSHGSFRWDIPVPNPEKIICVGVNFPDRNEEYKDGKDAPPNMSLFVRFPALIRWT